MIKMECLLCHWEPDEKEGKHLPEVIDKNTGTYVCKECNTRCKTVDSFGLTVEELKSISIIYKALKELIRLVRD